MALPQDRAQTALVVAVTGGGPRHWARPTSDLFTARGGDGVRRRSRTGPLTGSTWTSRDSFAEFTDAVPGPLRSDRRFW